MWPHILGSPYGIVVKLTHESFNDLYCRMGNHSHTQDKLSTIVHGKQYKVGDR